MSDIIIYGPYKINYSPEFANELYNMTPKLHKEFGKLISEILQLEPEKVMKKVISLNEKHPNAPQIRDLLVTVYSLFGELDKASEISNSMLTEFPNYIPLKLALVQEAIDSMELNQAMELLGEGFTIQGIYPQRNEFHVDEVAAYELEVIRYLLAIDETDEAEERLEKLAKIAPDSRYLEEAEEIFDDYLENVYIPTEDTKLRIIRDSENDPDLREQLKQLRNQQIRALYEYEMPIPWQSMSDILELPRESLVQDLIWVLTNTKEYSDFYLEEIEGNPVLHSFFILGELKAAESLPVVLDFLRLDSNTLENWCGDHLSESLWWYFYQIAEQNPELLKDALIDQHMHCYPKSTLTQALTQIAFHHPDLNERVAALFESTFTYYLQFDVEHEEVDMVFLSFALCELCDNGLAELIPSWEKLYEKGFVDESICGDVEEYKIELKRMGRNRVRPILPIQEFYKNILDTWAGYKEERSDDDDMTDAEINEWSGKSTAKRETYYAEPRLNEKPVVRETPKIGRNEPCPCGSGRKYKVCCGKD
jgi:tetratricopeptide (TPR) repeat protein